MGKAQYRKTAYGEAYLTVYLALTMAALLSLCLTLTEGVRRSAAAAEAEVAAAIGLHNIFAEYHRELLEQYNLFAVDSSYGTTMTGKANTERRLRGYLEKNMNLEDVFLKDFLYRDFLGLSVEDVELTKISVLTDEGGRVFRRRAVEAVKDDASLELLAQLQDWLYVIESRDLAERNVEEEKSQADRQIEEYNGTQVQREDGEWVTVEVQNPTEYLDTFSKQGILNLVTGKMDPISMRELDKETLIGARMRRGQASRGNFEEKRAEGQADSFFFGEYCMRYLGRYGAEKENGALAYQLEYLIAGENSDMENLKAVINKLLLLREAANALYLFSDKVKCAEAEALAAATATLLTLPQLTPLLKTTILLGWAYAESLYDVKTMLAGGRIPLIKTSETWHYGLEGALRGNAVEAGGKEGEGLAYEDYLRIFMLMADSDVLAGRVMDMAEADIRLTPGNGSFRLDGCYDRVEARIWIKSSYGYDYEIVRQKIY